MGGCEERPAVLIAFMAARVPAGQFIRSLVVLARRRSKTIAGTTTHFLYDGLTPVQELSSGTPMANLLTGLGIDEYFTRTDSVGVHNYLTDALGSSVTLADGSGTVQTEYTYEPFGRTSATGTPTSNAFGFTGREIDGTGLSFYRVLRSHHQSLHLRGSNWLPGRN
jgi:hypothetical protein